MSRLSALAVAVAVATLVVGCSSDTAEDGADAAADGQEAVVRDVLGEVADPPGADGTTLTLVRYTVAPGAELSPHVHPGVQLASIESGTLSYTVESGTAVVQRADGSTEDLTGPTSTELRPGDAVEEPFDMVHFGANDTDEPVVIIATLLTPEGHDLAEDPTVTTTATA